MHDSTIITRNRTMAWSNVTKDTARAACAHVYNEDRHHPWLKHSIARHVPVITSGNKNGIQEAYHQQCFCETYTAWIAISLTSSTNMEYMSAFRDHVARLHRSSGSRLPFKSSGAYTGACTSCTVARGDTC